MKFAGKRTESGCVVTVEGASLNPRLDLFNHSPDGFEWGYGGSGPAQLALAILAAFIDDDLAVEYYQMFKADVIQEIATDQWVLESDEILSWCREVGAIEPADSTNDL